MSPEATRDSQQAGRNLARLGFGPERITEFTHSRQDYYVVRSAYEKEKARLAYESK